VPEERWEWVAFSLGIAATVVLLAMIVFRHGSNASDPRPAAVTAPVTTPATTTAQTTTAARPPATTAPTTTRAETPPAPVRLTLKARRDTWLSVHRTSSAGTLLYEGTLAAGASRTFSGSAFEVRFGAAANVQATLNGKPLPLPGGTYSVTVGKTGLGARSA
jgi:hypothetical protein